VKEEALKDVESFFQETKQVPFITTIKDNTMKEESMVKSPSKNLSQETFGDFEKHTRDIGSNLMRKMGYDGKGIGK
jgi:hypothetical protein